jgi:hypothetical protein
MMLVFMFWFLKVHLYAKLIPAGRRLVARIIHGDACSDLVRLRVQLAIDASCAAADVSGIIVSGLPVHGYYRSHDL